MRYLLISFHDIYKAEYREQNSVKKSTLFEHSELGLFRSGVNAMKVVGSYRLVTKGNALG